MPDITRENVIDAAAEGLELERRIRDAVLAGDQADADIGLERADGIAWASGSLIVAHVAHEDPALAAHELEAMHELRARIDAYSATYAEHQPASRKGGNAHDGIVTLLGFAARLHDAIRERDSFPILEGRDAYTREAVVRLLETHQLIFAPLSLDLIYAHVVNILVGRALGRSWRRIVPAAPDPDERSLHTVLASDAPMPTEETPFIFVNGAETRGTLYAIHEAIQARRARERGE